MRKPLKLPKDAPNIAHVPNRKPGSKGFTLIEMLIAISILATVAILSWRGLDSIVRARKALVEQLDQTRGMQLTFAQLQSDCAQIVNPSLIPGQIPVVADQDRLILIRTVYEENQPSRLQVVIYRLKDGVLTRHESKVTRDLMELGILWQSANNDTDTTPAVIMQHDIAAMIVQMWFSDSPGWRVTSIADAAKQSGAAYGNTGPVATGLEFSLQLKGHQASMTKIFLIGPV